MNKFFKSIISFVLFISIIFFATNASMPQDKLVERIGELIYLHASEESQISFEEGIHTSCNSIELCKNCNPCPEECSNDLSYFEKLCEKAGNYTGINLAGKVLSSDKFFSIPNPFIVILIFFISLVLFFLGGKFKENLFYFSNIFLKVAFPLIVFPLIAIFISPYIDSSYILSGGTGFELFLIGFEASFPPRSIVFGLAFYIAGLIMHGACKEEAFQK